MVVLFRKLKFGTLQDMRLINRNEESFSRNKDLLAVENSDQKVRKSRRTIASFKNTRKTEKKSHTQSRNSGCSIPERSIT